MFHPLAAERIGHDLPGIKLIALVRDPVERAYSAHKHERARGFETEPFERAIELEPERLHGEVERMRHDPTYESFSHRHHAYLRRGRYAEQLAALVRHCGRDNVFVLDADAFFAQPQQHYGRVLSFLGLPAHDGAPLSKRNAQPGAPLADNLRRRLRAEFEAQDEALVEFLGETPSWRR
jgi:hypothetical protein